MSTSSICTTRFNNDDLKIMIINLKAVIFKKCIPVIYPNDCWLCSLPWDPSCKWHLRYNMAHLAEWCTEAAVNFHPSFNFFCRNKYINVLSKTDNKLSTAVEDSKQSMVARRQFISNFSSKRTYTLLRSQQLFHAI